jgi:hypothetical protein
MGLLRILERRTTFFAAGIGAAIWRLLRRMPKFTFGIETESVSTLVRLVILLVIILSVGLLRRGS